MTSSNGRELRRMRRIIKKCENVIDRNEMEVEGKPQPIITASDLMEKDMHHCGYCLLHRPHTPCGDKFALYRQCSTTKVLENDTCDSYFKQFFDCCYTKSKIDYYNLRSALLFSLSTSELMEKWFRIQKRQLFNNLNKNYDVEE